MTPNSETQRDAPRRAVALRYERASEDAPRVVAHGQGRVAETILAFARANGVPVHEDADMVELLSACELGAEISPELYEVVAQLLAFLYRTNERLVREEQAAGAAAQEPA
jgi:flagellar biosynthesis protein